MILFRPFSALYTPKVKNSISNEYEEKTENFEYDLIGNPTLYKGISLASSWTKCRQLTSFNGTTFSYNGQGQRISKKKGTEPVITFTYDSSGNLIKQSNGIEYLYDNSGECGIIYNSVPYFYRKNAQGDITHILDNSGNIVVKYTYDAWGNHKVYTPDGTENTNSTFIGNINPIRYRGYYFDLETGLFYTPGRYYDPEVGRWINADDVAYLDPETIGGLNLYAYSLNNPVMYYDPTGNFAISIFLICLGIGLVAGAALGGYTAVQSGAELWSKDFWIGVGTGALIGGAVGAVAGLGGAFLAGGLSSLAGKFVADAASSLMFGTNNFGTWEDYAIAFVMGGLLKGLPLGKLGTIGKDVARFAGDVAIRPALNQLAKMGTRGAEFDLNNYLYTVATRAATFNIGFGNVKFGMLGSEFSLSFGKSIMRGFLSGFRKKYMR